jgi:choline dehydrogenase-like flavoprotein
MQVTDHPLCFFVIVAIVVSFQPVLPCSCLSAVSHCLPPVRAHGITNTHDYSQDGLEGRQILVPQGRLLGGSNGLNGMVIGGPSEANINAWAALGNPGWEWPNFLRALNKAMTVTSPHKGPEGDGPLQVTILDKRSGWAQAWRDTVTKLGLPATDPVFGDIAEAVHPELRQRSYVGNTYLDAAKDRANLTIWTNTVANKILFDKSPEVVATGVEVTKDGETQIVTASKEVIVTAGTINSPKILELSGVGGARILSPLGIDVVIDNPNVGENLQNHPMAYLAFETLDEDGEFATNDKLVKQDPAAIGAAMAAYVNHQGPLARSGTLALAQLPLLESKSEEGKKEIQKALELLDQPQDLGKTSPAYAKAHATFVRDVVSSFTETTSSYLAMSQYVSPISDGAMVPAAGTESFFTIATILSYPLSRGSVHITSASGSPKDLAIDPRYLTHPLDLELFARHYRLIETLASTQPLASHLKPDGKRSAGAPAPGVLNDLEKTKEYLKKAAVGGAHYTSSCSMLPLEKGGVVDSKLRVHGCKNLRVCDASIIPITPRTNIQATVFGVAERAAEIIKEDL